MMRRGFSVFARHMQKPRVAELAFLEQVPLPPAQNPALHPSTPAPPSSKLSVAGLEVPHEDAVEMGEGTSQGKLGTTEAMKQLMNAVRRRRFDTAEQLFARVPRLWQRPAALRLLIKMYCEQRDFTTARAVLFATLHKVGEEGAGRYVAHATYSAQNARDIEEVVQRVADELKFVSPRLAATALYGLRYLGDEEAFDRVWKLIARRFFEPSLKQPTLHARVLDALLREDWEAAARLWRIADGLQNADARIPRLRVWFMAARHFLVDELNPETADRVVRMLRALGLELNAEFSAMLVRNLAPHFPALSATDWLRLAREQQWPVDGTVAELMLAQSRRGLTARFGKELGRRVHARVVARLTAHNLRPAQHRLGEGPRFSSDIAQLQTADSPETVLEILHAMQKRGLRVPYSACIDAFHRITQLLARNSHYRPKSTNQSGSASAETSQDSGLEELKNLMRSEGYPLHCASIDLSMLELAFARANLEDEAERLYCSMWLQSYIQQYPPVGQDLPLHTRLAVLAMRIGAYEEAAGLVDDLRRRQPHDRKFSAANHDSASLQVLASCKFRMHEPLVPLLRGVTTDNADIYLDETFFSKIKELLILRDEDLDVLAELKSLNEHTLAKTYSEIDEIAAAVAAM